MSALSVRQVTVDAHRYFVSDITTTLPVGHVWNESWLPKMAEKKRLNCPHVKDEFHRILLTGDTPQLRAFVERLPVEAFDSGVTLTRIKEEPKKAVTPKPSEK